MNYRALRFIKNNLGIEDVNNNVVKLSIFLHQQSLFYFCIINRGFVVDNFLIKSGFFLFSSALILKQL